MEQIKLIMDKNIDITAIVKFNLHKYNQQHCDYIKNNSSYAHNNKIEGNVAIFDGDECIGGALGEILFGWYQLTDIWLDSNYRGKGIGEKVIDKIEDFAKEHQALGVKIDFLSFQTPEFYKKLGYIEWAKFEDCPPGTIHYYLYKKF